MKIYLPILQLFCKLFFGKTRHHSGLSFPLHPRFDSLRLLVFSKAKTAVESEEICECNGHRVYKLSQQRPTADLLAPRESDCWQTCSKISSDWLPSYIMAMQPVLEIFKMAGYFPDSPRMCSYFKHMQSVQYLPALSWQCLYQLIMTIQSSVVSTYFNTKMSLPLDYWVNVHNLMWQMSCWWYTPWSTLATFLPYCKPFHLTPPVNHSPLCLKLHCASEYSLININYIGQSPEKLTGPQILK
jgi:hypothetical protein